MKSVAIYRRSSTNGGRKLTCTNQKNSIENYLKEQKEQYNLIDFEEVGSPFGVFENIEFNKMIDRVLNSNINTILVADLDRISKYPRESIAIVALLYTYNINIIETITGLSSKELLDLYGAYKKILLHDFNNEISFGIPEGLSKDFKNGLELLEQKISVAKNP